MERFLSKARNKEVRQYGITSAEAAVLFVIDKIGHGVIPAEISRLLVREPHSVSSLVARMEKRGLVRKIKGLSRKNLVGVIMTEKGEQAYRQSARRESIVRIMSCLSEEECQQLRVCMHKLRDRALEELGLAKKYVE